MIGTKKYLPKNWSITGERVEVEIIDVDWDAWTCKVKYPSGYEETMPISALEGH